MINQLVTLSPDQAKVLTDAGIASMDDLSALAFEDFKRICPGLTVVQQRRLEKVGLYHANGGTFKDGETTYKQVTLFLAYIKRGMTTKKALAHAKNEDANVDDDSDAEGKKKSDDGKDDSALRMYINTLEKFDGEPISWIEWEKTTKTTLGQTIFAPLLGTPPKDNPKEKKRNQKLYNVLLAAVQHGSAEHVVQGKKDDGHAAWAAMQEWYGSAENSRIALEDTRNKLLGLCLDEDITATTYINRFIKYSKKLEDHNEGYSKETKMDMFLRGITDDDYDVCRQNLRSGTGTTFDQCVVAVRKREQELGVLDLETTRKKARRGHQRPETDNNKKTTSIPSIPYFVLKYMTDRKAKAALMQWRRVWNEDGRQLLKEEFEDGYQAQGHSKDDASRKGNQSKDHSKRKRGAKNRVRRTKTESVGTEESGTTLKVRFKDDEDDSSCGSDVSSADDSDGDSGSESGTAPAKKSKARRKGKARRNPIEQLAARRGRQAYARALLDSGTDYEVIGGVGWQVTQRYDRETEIGGAFEGSPGSTLPVVSALTIYEHPDQGPILLGIGAAAWDDRVEQNESLLNSHELRRHGVDVDDITERDGGTQTITVDGIPIRMTFEGERTLHFKIRRPTAAEIDELDPHWLIPVCQEATCSLLMRRNKALIRTGDIPWRERLGFCPADVLTATMEATTQLCSSPVEMDNREAPRQHRKSRVLPLHPRRVPGRTDSDTYFSTVKSVRGYTCVQVFVSLVSQYLYAVCMRREQHSHGAYQDFVRYVGVPNTLLTDNAQTQVGEKWRKTSRQYATKQIATAPHNQNQNCAERKIQDLKKRTRMILQRVSAPVVFWCYCLHYVVDCFNHVSHSTLEWRTPVEKMHGNTPDISMFRFRFWEPVWFYEPTARHPDPNFLPGRFVGIAWNHGDAFTYRVWTTPGGDWEKGRELIRNIVKGRDEEDVSPTHVDDTDGLDFTSERPTTRKTRKRKRRGGDEAGQPDNEARPAAAGPVCKQQQSDGDARGCAVPGEKDGKHDTTTPAPTSKTSESGSDGAATDADRTTGIDFDPADQQDQIEMVDEVNDEMNNEDSPAHGDDPVGIDGHHWENGELKLKVRWGTEEHTWERIRDAKLDYPRMAAQYILDNKVSRGKRDRNFSWASKTIRDVKRTARRITRLYDLTITDTDAIKLVRRVQRNGTTNKKKKKQNFNKPVFKYGVQVPRTVRQALELDEKRGDDLWAEAIKKEIRTLNDVECFEFHDPGYKLQTDYQKTTLRVIFDVKHDLRRKARLVAGGHLVELLDTNVYSSTVKPISVKILHVIAAKQGLKQLCGDVGNAYINAYTNEKVYSIAGPEFGEKEGHVVVIRKALYGLKSSSERWHSHFSDTLRGLGFITTRYDNDVWIKKNRDEYEYLCTHVDDFMIVSRNPQPVMDELERLYTIKGKGPPDYYLGNDYKKQKNGRWAVGCKKYLVEALKRVEEMFGSLPKQTTPLPTNDHPELDNTFLLDDDRHRKYQMLLGMLNWLVGIGRFDIAHAVTSMSRFSSCPRKGHLERVLRIFGYLKRRRNRRIVIDARDPEFEGDTAEVDADPGAMLQSAYPEAREELDANLPTPVVDEMAISVFVDSDHAHDKLTRRSITGMMIFVGRTPVFYSSKRQGAIETSTYGAEFCAMRLATEEAISVRYMLRCLGVKVTKPTLMFGDNLGVIQNATLKESLLKKKHTAINYHKVREATAAGIVHPVKIHTTNNFADVLTKSLPRKAFANLTGRVIYG